MQKNLHASLNAAVKKARSLLPSSPGQILPSSACGIAKYQIVTGQQESNNCRVNNS